MAKILIGVIVYNKDPKTLKAISLIQSWSKETNGIEVHWPSDYELDLLEGEIKTHPRQMRKCDLLLSIGGDGTFLSAARLISGLQTPILGVHTGKTGFLTDYPVNGLKKALNEIVNGSISMVPRLMLDIKVTVGTKKIFEDTILNDIQIKPSHTRGMVNLKVQVNDKYLTDYWADSLLISTPTGSTAYNLAAGGPIVYPTSETVVINPVNPPSLSVRPLVVPANAKLHFKENENTPSLLILDGRLEKEIPAEALIEIKRSPHVTHFVKSKSYGFVDALREKLGWEGNFRNTRINN